MKSYNGPPVEILIDQVRHSLVIGHAMLFQSLSSALHCADKMHTHAHAYTQLDRVKMQTCPVGKILLELGVRE